MPAETIARPLDRTCRALTGLLERSLDGHGGVRPEIHVAALGVRDELAVTSTVDPAEAGSAIPVRVYGNQAVVGPFPVPGRPARPCPVCLARRWQSVRFSALRDALELGFDTSEAGRSPYATAFVADAVAALVRAHRDRERVEELFPPVFVVDLDSLAVRRYPLIPDAECPRCGRADDDDRETARITVHPAPKHASEAFRRRGIDDYGLAVEAFANPVCGALGPTVLSDLSSLSTSATFGAFSTRSGSYLRETLWGGHADSYRRSIRIGVLEGLERYAGIRARGKKTAVHGSFAALRADALDPRECGVYSEEFYRSHPEVTPFSPDREIPWVWGYSLRDERPVLVPEVLAYYHAPGLADRFVQETSNGSASGGCLEEAIYFGLMEVVERDAFLLMWYGRAAMPEIDPQSCTRARTRQMVDRLALYGYRARFFDLRVTFGIPVVTAVATRIDGGLGTMCFGAGASLDPEAAVSAALCEIATDAVHLRSRTERDEARLRAMAADFDRVTALHDHPLMYGIPDMAEYADFLLGRPGERRAATRSMTDLYRGTRPAPPISADLTDDVRRCIAAVTDAGFDVIVVDQTLPEERDLGLRTVKVLVPGLLPIDFGWLRQRALLSPRLRTAHREAGLRDRDLEPAELNRVPHPFP